jgi:phenylpyruvate tautomerase
MPLLYVVTSAPHPAPEAREALSRGLSALLSRELGKAEQWVMVALAPRVEILFAGSSSPALYAELKNVGVLDQARREALSKVLCATLGRGFGVPPERIYLEFSDVDGAHWGWNGETFA